MRRALALAVVAFGVLAPTASAVTTLNVIPHGQWEPGVPWAASPGMLPADTQARMYDRLTPLFRDVTDDAARAEHRRQRLLQVGGAGRRERPVARHQRDRQRARRPASAPSARASSATPTASRTSTATPIRASIFAAGYVDATDRSLLLDQARSNGVAGADRHPGRAGHPARARPLQLQADQEGPRPGDGAADQVDRGAGRAGARSC